MSASGASPPTHGPEVSDPFLQCAHGSSPVLCRSGASAVAEARADAARDGLEWLTVEKRWNAHRRGGQALRRQRADAAALRIIGLLEPSERTSAGYREYSDADIGRIFHIEGLRRLGMILPKSGGASTIRLRHDAAARRPHRPRRELGSMPKNACSPPRAHRPARPNRSRGAAVDHRSHAFYRIRRRHPTAQSRPRQRSRRQSSDRDSGAGGSARTSAQRRRSNAMGARPGRRRSRARGQELEDESRSCAAIRCSPSTRSAEPPRVTNSATREVDDPAGAAGRDRR